MTELGRIVIRGFQERGVMAVAKHFPGLGRADTDPHFHLPSILSDKREIYDINLLPFKAAVEEGVSAFMTSHAIYPGLDIAEPATMSSRVLTDLTRKELGFEGLIITDDLEMGAIAKQWGVVKGAESAFIAGADILLICEDQKFILDSISHIHRLISQNRLYGQRLTQSYKRISDLKKRYLSQGTEISLPAVKAYFG